MEEAGSFVKENKSEKESLLSLAMKTKAGALPA